MADRPLTLGIYYTNTSPLSTIIWLNIATKLCQEQKPVLGPLRGQKDTAFIFTQRRKGAKKNRNRNSN